MSKTFDERHKEVLSGDTQIKEFFIEFDINKFMVYAREGSGYWLVSGHYEYKNIKEDKVFQNLRKENPNAKVRYSPLAASKVLNSSTIKTKEII
jgi:hypothetical protein